MGRERLEPVLRSRCRRQLVGARESLSPRRRREHRGDALRRGRGCTAWRLWRCTAHKREMAARYAYRRGTARWHLVAALLSPRAHAASPDPTRRLHPPGFARRAGRRACPADSPFATLRAAAARRRRVFTFLLLGHQNAGTGHLPSHVRAPRRWRAWLEGSFLPIPTSSPQRRRRHPPPHRQWTSRPSSTPTSAARASSSRSRTSPSLSTSLSSATRCTSASPRRTQYAAVQLIEIGGDHLARVARRRDELGGDLVGARGARRRVHAVYSPQR